MSCQTDEFPACTLPAAELGERVEEIAAIGRAHLLGAEGSELRFDKTARAKLEWLIEAESHCCAPLTFDLSERDDHLALAITGPGSQAFHTAFTAG